MREIVENVAGVFNFDAQQQVFGFLERIASGDSAMGLDGFGDLVPDGEDRIERRHRVLKDHGSRAAAQPGEIVLARLAHINAIEFELCGADFSRCRQ